MSHRLKMETGLVTPISSAASSTFAGDSLPRESGTKAKPKMSDRDDQDDSGTVKRRCVSTACIACRKRKSKVRTASPLNKSAFLHMASF